jgi:predicted MFS family arabinose efflux permease
MRRGVRLVATHFERGRGVATGVVVGALTLGSATPHLVRGAGNVPWQATIATTSVLALLGALTIRSVRAGPGATAAPPLDARAAVRALRDRRLRLATIGYVGHVWELYAFWAWLPAFFAASRTTTLGDAPSRVLTGAIVFAAIGFAGLAGSVAAGRIADRLGRTATTSAVMLVSAACCLLSPFAFAAPTPLLAAVLIIWGAAVIADSAQFSAAATELAEPRYAGSALTLQLALGFAVTIASIRLVAIAAGVVGWRFTLLPLAAGPLAGTVAMLRLRASPADDVSWIRGGRGTHAGARRASPGPAAARASGAASRLARACPRDSPRSRRTPRDAPRSGRARSREARRRGSR